MNFGCPRQTTTVFSGLPGWDRANPVAVATPKAAAKGKTGKARVSMPQIMLKAEAQVNGSATMALPQTSPDTRPVSWFAP